MAVGDIYVIKMKQVYFTEVILNVFFYRQNSIVVPGLTDADGLFEAFNRLVLAQWDDMVNTSISITELEVFSIEFPVDNFVGTPGNDVGKRVIADNLRAPSWIAAGFKSNRAGPGTRSSFKRFAGLGEVDIDDNSISPAFIALAGTQGMVTLMGIPIATTGGSEYTPVQVKSGWVLGVAPTENFVLTSWIDPKLTSQVSRKP